MAVLAGLGRDSHGDYIASVTGSCKSGAPSPGETGPCAATASDAENSDGRDLVQAAQTREHGLA